MWLLLSSIGPAHGVTLVVDRLAGPYTTVADALAVAAPGDVLEIRPGNYRERVTIDVDNLTLRGTDRQTVRLEATDIFAPADGFLVADRVQLTIEDLTMTGGGLFRALRLDRQADVTMNRVTLDSGGFLGNGSLVHVHSSASLTLNDCDLQTGSSGSGRGGLVAVDGTFTASHTTFSGGTSLSDGGALYCAASATCQVDDSRFEGNTALLGGAVHLDGTAPGPWRRNTFCGNTATEHGGAIYQTTAGTHENSVFQDNSAILGGGGLWLQGGVQLINVDLLGNAADAGAAVFQSQGALQLRSSLVAYNQLPAVNAIYDGPGAAVIEYVAFDGNAPLVECNTALGTGCQPEGTATPLISYVAGDCAATDVRPAAGSSLIDQGDPASPDPDGTPNDIGSTGGPSACNRAEVIADGIDQDCDAGDLCYLDDDGDGRGEPGAGTVASDDLDCIDSGESADESDVCPGHDDLADCDLDGIHDGCDDPCPEPTGDTAPPGDTGTEPVAVPTADTGGTTRPVEPADQDPVVEEEKGCGCNGTGGGLAPFAFLVLSYRRRGASGPSPRTSAHRSTS